MPRFKSQKEYNDMIEKLKQDRNNERLREAKARRALEDKGALLVAKLLLEEGSDDIFRMVNGLTPKIADSNKAAFNHIVQSLAQRRAVNQEIRKKADTHVGTVTTVSNEPDQASMFS